MILEKFDTVTAVCTYATQNGTYVEIGGDHTVGWIKNQRLKKGTQVYCTVEYINRSDFPVLLLDSVVYDVAA